MDNTAINYCKASCMRHTMPADGRFELVCLPYDTDDLCPVISADTLELHHGKHLQTYLNNLNAIMPSSQYEGMSLEEIVCKADGAAFNNAGQVLNHNMYFTQFRVPRRNNVPSGTISEAIVREFGSFDNFKTVFMQKAMTLFGSGWAWLSADSDGRLVITQEINAGNPVIHGLHPLMCFDVWEHAYYLDYHNRRADHIAALWQIVDWRVVEKRLNAVNNN